MAMKLTLGDFGELQSDLQKMAILLEANGEGKAVDNALVKAAVPIREDMLRRTTIDPKMITHNLHNSITTGKPGSAGGVRRIKTGVFKDKMVSAAPHAHLVEFGHGGPAPAPPHPYVRPAFDAQADNAFRIIREELEKALGAAFNK